MCLSHSAYPGSSTSVRTTKTNLTLRFLHVTKSKKLRPWATGTEKLLDERRWHFLTKNRCARKTVGNYHGFGFNLKIYSEFATLALVISRIITIFMQIWNPHMTNNSQLIQIVTVHESQLHEFSLESWPTLSHTPGLKYWAAKSPTTLLTTP